VPAAAVLARHAAARRADQPPRTPSRSPGWKSTSRPTLRPSWRDARSLLPRQRGRVDPRARPRPRHPLERATTPPGSSRRKRASPQKRRPRKACARCWPRNWNGCARIPRRARPRARRACSATKNWPRASSRNATRPTKSTSRRASGSATWSSRPRGCARPTATACCSTT
jgi:hypothetical protein